MTFPKYAKIADIKAKADKTIIVLSAFVRFFLFLNPAHNGISGIIKGINEEIILNLIYSPMHKTLLSSQVSGQGSQKS